MRARWDMPADRNNGEMLFTYVEILGRIAP
jgi:hypothetical protein